MITSRFWDKGNLESLLARDTQRALEAVGRLKAEEVLHSDANIAITTIVNSVCREPLVLDWDRITRRKPIETTIRTTEFGETRDMIGLKVDIQIPISGDLEVLRHKASTFSLSSIPWKIEDDGHVILSVSKVDLDAETVKRELEKARQSLINAIEWANNDLAAHKNSLSGLINSKLTARRERLEKAEKLESELDLN